MKCTIDVEREEDGRWRAEVADFPGIHAYGGHPDEAITQAEALALHVLADRLEAGILVDRGETLARIEFEVLPLRNAGNAHPRRLL